MPGTLTWFCCQELLTYWHLRLLVRRMRSFRQVNYRPAPTGPAGGLVTFSRRPVSGTAYRRFGRPPRTPGVPRTSRFQARLKGALVTRLARPGLCVINTHPVANHDGDWSKANRYYPLHRAQFAVLAHVVDEAGPRAVVCGDFNIARESSLFGAFMAATGLADAFEGACPPTLFMTRQPTERAAAPGVSAETGEGQARALLDGHRREDKPGGGTWQDRRLQAVGQLKQVIGQRDALAPGPLVDEEAGLGGLPAAADMEGVDASPTTSSSPTRSLRSSRQLDASP